MKVTHNEGVVASVVLQEPIGQIGSPGVFVDLDLEFNGHWNGGRSWEVSYEDSQHHIECY